MDNIISKKELRLSIPAKTINSLQAWIIVFACTTFCFYQFVLLNMFNSLNASIMKEFHLTAVGLGYLSSLYFYANMFFLIPAGILIDRYSTRRIILISMSVSLVSTFLFALATNSSIAMIARFSNGIGGAFCFLGMIRIATKWFSPRKLGLVIGLAVSFIVSGGVLAQAPLTLLIDHVGWRNSLFIFGLGGLSMIIFIYLTVQDSPEDNDKHADKKEKFKLLLFGSVLISALKNPQTWLGGLYGCLMNTPIFILGALWGSLYLTQGLGLDRSDATMIISMIYVGMIFGSPCIGWLSDTIGLRKLPMALFAGLAFITMCLLINLTTFSLLKLICIFFALGFFLSAQVLIYPFMAETSFPKLVGTAESIGNTILILGGLTQALFAKVLELQWDHKIKEGIPIYSLGNFQRSLSIILIGFALALFVALLSKETHCKMQHHEKNER